MTLSSAKSPAKPRLVQAVAQLETQMREAAKNFDFERAASIRDRVRALKQRDLGAIFSTVSPLEVGGATDAAGAAAASAAAVSVGSADAATDAAEPQSSPANASLAASAGAPAKREKFIPRRRRGRS